MVILHIASIENDLCSGVCVAVPHHVMAQQKIETVSIINLTNSQVEGAATQFEYKKPFLISSLPKPFAKPDLVVFHEIYKFAYVKIAKQLRMLGIPYVIIPHGSLTKVAQRKKWVKKISANIVFFNKFIDGSDAIQFLSDKEKEQSSFGKNKFVSTNGIDIPSAKKECFNRECVKLLYIGSMHWRIKGLDLMLSAIGENADKLRKNNVTMDLFGPSNQDKKSKVKYFIETNGVLDIVYLNDAVVGEEKTQKLLGCDIFIQTSRSEGMPMGILEALSYGVPCLVTEGTNLGELIKKYDAGWVAKTEVESISATIEQAIYERHFWIEKSKNARRLIQENFVWEKIARETITNYKQILTSEEN